MTILFITKLMATAAAGPNWSVPARIKAQAAIDNVYWINVDDSIMPHWIETGLYHSLKDIGGKLRLKNLPEEFSTPDIVVFEVPFFVEYLGFASELRKKNIPYIIVPRCSFTHQALNNHAKWKKRIAGWLFFNRFFKGARAIQYLTPKEKEDSTPFMCSEDFILPNGINLPTISKQASINSSFTGIFIGRIDIYHKGLDILLEAIINKQEYLRLHNVVFDIYGPENEDSNKLKEKVAVSKVGDLFRLKGKIEGAMKDQVLRSADFFIMTSRFEGLPMAMLEALSYSLPCIASDGTYLRSEIDEYDAGIGCDGSVESVEGAICRFIENKNKIEYYKKNALTLASKYKWDEQAYLFHNILESLINN